jgi:hypothetical protein
VIQKEQVEIDLSIFGVKWRALELAGRMLLLCAESSPLEKTLASLFIRARNQWENLSSINCRLY